jgi:AraC-like DNA-binding protein
MAVDVSFKNPGKKLEWLVKQFQVIKFDGISEVLDKFIPRDDISLVFHFNTPPFMLKPVEGQLPAYFIAPVITRANLMRISKRTETFVITCKPTVFSRIFNISLAPGPHIYLSLPENPFHQLWQELTTIKHMDDRIACFGKFIADTYSGPYVPDEVDRFYEKIITEGFNIPVAVLAKNLAVCERTLQRQFKTRVGVCPKSLARIVRINFLWGKLQNEEPVDYHNVVFEGNYFDQTHFIKDFKDITDETPGRFFMRDLRYVKILSGRKN